MMTTELCENRGANDTDLVMSKEDERACKNVEKNEFQLKEGGYGWLIVFVTTVCAGITGSMFGNYSLVQDKIPIAYNETDNYAIQAGLFNFEIWP